MWKDALGVIVVLAALFGLGLGVFEVRGHDYVGAALALGAGLFALRSGVSLLRPTVGE